MICVQTLEKECRALGIKFHRFNDFHCVVRSRYEVNVFPTTGRAHLKGGVKSGKVQSVDHILELARGEEAMAVGPLAKRRPLGNIKQRLWRLGHYCGLCKDPIDSIHEATVDHVIPLARGGSNHFDNLQLAHQDCNSNKGAQLEA